MHDIRRNLLYEVKKQANKRADPFLNPNSQDDDIRAENQRLRTKIRAQDTQIIRLNGKIDELNQKLILNATKYRTQQSNRESSIKQAVNQFSAVPMLLQNKELKQSNQILHQQNLVLNGKNNELQAQLRQLKSDKYSLELRIKQFNILQKMRQQRFRDQVDRLTPIIISEPSQYTAVKNSIRYLTGFLRQKIVDVLDNLFILGVKQCQSNKKLNSYTVFKNYWKELQSRKNYGYMAATSSYSAVRKVMRIIDEKYGEIDLDQGQISGTLDQWVMHSVIQIKSVANAEGPEQLRKLFRLLALKYRCKFPIKGQTCELNQQVKAYLDHEICIQAIKLLSPKKIQNQLKQNENAILNKFK